MNKNITPKENCNDIHKAIDQTTALLLAMTKEQRIEWFQKSQYPHLINFETQIGNTVYSVTNRFNKNSKESLQEKAERIILNSI